MRLKTPTYASWQAMKTRCLNPNYSRKDWVGVEICRRWIESFDEFLADMGERPLGTTLDRYPDRSGNYEPGNCRWATPLQQAENRSNNLPVIGVRFLKQYGSWIAYGRRKLGKQPILYRGADFFEAVCARKSYDAKTGSSS